MNVLVDTSVWSLALRHRKQPAASRAILDELARIIASQGEMLIGPIRQEILSGIRDRQQYEHLRTYLRAFDDVAIVREDYERAAESFNACQAAGISAKHVDLLICAVAHRLDAAIFSLDHDFQKLAPIVGISLHAVPLTSDRPSGH